ncbi:MAG: primosomal protein N' [Clostridia bacterium]|nr:primosomal protein N' [Clostridia bacterium]
MKSALVYVMDVPYYADKAYSYYVPEMLDESVVPGALVEVPFGIGNRRMTGVVSECRFTDTEDERMKPVVSVLGDGPLLSEEMLGLCRFVKEYTLCTFGDAVRAAVPSAAMSKVVHSYRVVPREERASDVPFDDALEQLGERGRLVYHLVAGRQRFTRQTLSAEFEFDCTRILAQMVKLDLCEKYSEVKGSAGVKYRRILSLSESLALETKLDGSGEYLNGILAKLRGENQKKLLAAVAETGPVEENDAYTTAGIPASAGKTAAAALEKKNYLKIEKEDLYRNRFTAEACAFAEQRGSAKPALSPHQQEACGKIVGLYERGLPAAALLHGVTGSGKTNVILAAIDRVLEDGRGVIMLVPEIALTPQTVGIFMARYGNTVAVIHSALSNGERYDAWRRIKFGEARVVVGTRSAIFAPLPDIGMIIIDEEHEYTYKSDTNPKYHAHDIARYRCRDHNAVLVLSSATPSVTSYYKAQTGTYTLVELTERYGNAKLPDVQIYDMRGETANGNLSPIGDLLASRLMRDKTEGNQSILFLNRRGYNNYVSCRSCGKGIKCPHCSVTLTYHSSVKRASKEMLEVDTASDDYIEDRRRNGLLVCHLCGYRMRLPEKCPDCGKEHFLFMGCGTQKAEDDICAMLPDLRVLRMDHDTTQAKFSIEEILGKFRAGEADVLLGTQMVTKGHDFPKVATVGVLNSDSALMLDDYRAAERTFAMLTQVIGRAGRADVPGTAIIQTYNPDHEVLRYAAAQDYKGFYKGEIRLRKSLTFPPFCDIAVITLSSADEAYLGLVTTRMYERMLETLKTEFGDVPVVLYGPFEAPIYRMQNLCRMRFVLKCRLNRRTRDFISGLVCEFGRFTPTADKTKNDREAGTSVKNKGSAAVSGAKSNRKLTISVDLNPTTV